MILEASNIKINNNGMIKSCDDFRLSSGDIIKINGDDDIAKALACIYDGEVSGSFLIDGKNLLDIYKIRNLRRRQEFLNSIVNYGLFFVPANPAKVMNRNSRLIDEIYLMIGRRAIVNILNTIIRREMFTYNDIENLIKYYKENKSFLDYWCILYGVYDYIRDIESYINSGDTESIFKILIMKKRGIDVGEAVILRNIYKSDLVKNNSRRITGIERLRYSFLFYFNRRIFYYIRDEISNELKGYIRRSGLNVDLNSMVYENSIENLRSLMFSLSIIKSPSIIIVKDHDEILEKYLDIYKNIGVSIIIVS
ncbi:hypothetical protein [Picrophilus oshimae]|uniref:Uncharacterized protein n=1 Tax=Picrophilus torridus (strain ATCC 700027 / DSM 9790 / JCM 10055 / NBRC 100828 / KAW 2/3) TaxID=1122961 RepID=A0A8G2FVV4_PICTO|nr:hypothetical protein [Picrophilus oshimae]SMD30401.1 hypothetical protein SAMN02745355_0281 [Picrophilus oshimae DSM 9789]